MFGLIKDRFTPVNKFIAKNLENIVFATMKSCSASTYEIARSLCRENGKSFKTNISTIDRLLRNDDFQINDTWWRKHIGLLFDLLSERKLINKKDIIQINVDFTSSEDYFLILGASIIVDEKAITLYFSTRKYPKKIGKISYKKMESSFMNELKHLLPKEYHYVIVADRGFGNSRFMNLCQDNGFDFVIRLNTNLCIIDPNNNDNNDNNKDDSNDNNNDSNNKDNDNEYIIDPNNDDNDINKDNNNDKNNNDNKNNNDDDNNKIKIKINLQDIKQDSKFETEIVSWKTKRNFTIKTSKGNGSIWYLVSNNKNLDAFKIYSDRFKIEKIFQDCKSNGFKIEQNKIRKYSRFRRLLYIISLSHALLCVLGTIIKNTTNNIKKNSSETESLSLSLILAFFKLDIELSDCILRKPLGYLKQENWLGKCDVENAGE